MAVVRITNQTKWDIQAKIREQFQNRRAPLDARLTTLFTRNDELTSAMEGALLDMHKVTSDHIDKVAPFVYRQMHIDLTSINDVAVPYRYRRILLQRPIAVPYGWSNTKVSSPRLGPWATELLEHNRKMDELAKEEETFTAQVTKLLASCSTYKKALDIWPQLVSVTPQNILERHNRTTEKVVAVAPAVELDVDQLNLSAVRNTLAAADKE